MNNIVSYAKEHMESFDVRPLNRVDSLILSELSYFQLPQELSKARELERRAPCGIVPGRVL